jgi:hypothetical protein
MTSAAPYDATTAAYDDSAHSQLLQGSQPLQEGDTVRCGDNPDECKVIGTWRDWLWLHSLHPRNLAPFTARAGACKLLRRAEPPSWPNR